MTSASGSKSPTAKVEVIARHNISLSDRSRLSTLPLDRDGKFRLSPLDSLAVFWVPLSVVYIFSSPSASFSPSYTPSHSPRPDDLVASRPAEPIVQSDRLRRAISHVLNSYPHLTGRLDLTSEPGIPHVRQLGFGTTFLEAQCNTPLSAFDHRADPERLPGGGGNGLVPPFDMRPGAWVDEPFLHIQHTTFTCGSVALGVRMPHVITDGEGFARLVRDIGSLYSTQSDSSLNVSPVVRPFLSTLRSNASTAELEEWRSYQSAILHLPPVKPALPVELSPGIQATEGSHGAQYEHTPDPIQCKLLRFSPAQLAELKHRAAPAHGTGWVSTYSALTAYLYRSTHLARLHARTFDPHLAPLSQPHLLNAYNLRGRADGLPPAYFGNAVLNPLLTTITSAQIVESSLVEVASWIHTSINDPAFRQPELDKTLKWLGSLDPPDLARVKSKLVDGNGNLYVTAWNKLDHFYEVDFGAEAGKPDMVWLPPSPIRMVVDGLVYYIRPPRGEDGLWVSVTLSESTWSALEGDEELRQYMPPQ